MDTTFFLFMIAGFLAQMVDGCIGMAYGVSSTSLLLSIGVPPAAASASVHTAEVFTTFVSGISHYKLKNIDKKLFSSLVIPGVVGGILGAFILTNIDTTIIKPIINVYLIAMGIRIIYKAFGKHSEKIAKKLEGIKLYILGVIGGFLDAIGGGGWGPVVTTTLVADGNTPRYVIGSVNASEFFVTVAQALTFVTIIGLSEYWKIILGLAVGGVLAAPFAAFLVKKITPKVMMILVGTVVAALNIRNIILMLI
ncbi:MAG: sulfite exporter TauE/SafE family protein [Clostridiaceae bacterium]|nr:sulfite exporter TauE/SafE family protein [Clostridiaceae bacterium]